MPWTEQDRELTEIPERNYATPSEWDHPSQASTYHYEIKGCIRGNFWDFEELVALRNKYRQEPDYNEQLFLNMVSKHDPYLASHFDQCYQMYLQKRIPGQGYQLRRDGGAC